MKDHIICELTTITGPEGELVQIPSAGHMLNILEYDWQADQVDGGLFSVRLAGKDAGADFPAEVIDAFGEDE